MDKLNIRIVLIMMLIIGGCIEEKDTEIEKPFVELLSPLPCDTLHFGDSFVFRMRVLDNYGLGNVSMDLHHNFGHHNHGAHESCNMDAPKEAVHPYSDNWFFSLPAHKTDYVLDTLVTIPFMKTSSLYYDSGDYHFHIYVTDNEGYQVFTTMDVKILNN